VRYGTITLVICYRYYRPSAYPGWPFHFNHSFSINPLVHLFIKYLDYDHHVILSTTSSPRNWNANVVERLHILSLLTYLHGGSFFIRICFPN